MARAARLTPAADERVFPALRAGGGRGLRRLRIGTPRRLAAQEATPRQERRVRYRARARDLRGDGRGGAPRGGGARRAPDRGGGAPGPREEGGDLIGPRGVGRRGAPEAPAVRPPPPPPPPPAPPP